MPAPPLSPDHQTADGLLSHPHSSPSYHHELPGGDTEAVQEEEEKKVVNSETEIQPPPMSSCSRSASSPAKAEEAAEEQRLEPAVKEDSDSSPDGEEELPEFVYVDLQVIRKEVQCPICLGIIKKTRTVMECLHRFCRECIDKSMRMGNNECPACRTHCASRRSLRDDPRYDELIAALFPDIGKYEAEELAFCEEEKSRNKQIQASIAQIILRQSEALGKKRSYRKGRGVSSPSSSQRYIRETPYRRSKRKRRWKTEFESDDDDDDLENAEGQTSSYSGEPYKEFHQHKKITRRRSGSSHPFSPATSSGGLCTEDKLVRRSSYPGIMWNIETRTWGKNGIRSGHVRKNSQGSHITNSVGFLQNSEKKDDEHASSKTSSGADKQCPAANEPPQAQGSDKHDTHHLSSHVDDKSSLSEVVDQFRDRLQLSDDTKILPGFEANCISHGGQLILACQQKETS